MIHVNKTNSSKKLFTLIEKKSCWKLVNKYERKKILLYLHNDDVSLSPEFFKHNSEWNHKVCTTNSIYMLSDNWNEKEAMFILLNKEITEDDGEKKLTMIMKLNQRRFFFPMNNLILVIMWPEKKGQK